MSFIVREPGPLSLIVDLGRPNHRSRGVSLGGAADRAAFMQANGLVGNSSDVAGLEFALAGPTLEATADVGCVVFGAEIQIRVDNHIQKPGTTFNVRAGSTLRIGSASVGMRGYICLPGGFESPIILASQSSLEPIKRGDVLTCRPSHLPARSLAEPIFSWENNEVRLRCLAGAQSDWLDPAEFFGPTYQVTPASNRMGIRLQGKPLKRPQREMVSEPVCPGSVQVVNDGQCIILGVDGQTIGGYPKIAQVISADLDRLGQLRPNQRVLFERVDLEIAERLREERDGRLAQLLTRLTAGPLD